MSTKFYVLDQVFAGAMYLENDTIAQHMIIEAESAEQASSIAAGYGLFELPGCFCGCGDEYRFIDDITDDEFYTSLFDALVMVGQGESVIHLTESGATVIDQATIPGLSDAQAEYDRFCELSFARSNSKTTIWKLERELARLNAEIVKAKSVLHSIESEYYELEEKYGRF